MARAAEQPRRPWTYWLAIGGGGLVFLAILVVIMWPSKKVVRPRPEDDAPRDPTVPDRAYLVGGWDCRLTPRTRARKRPFKRPFKRLFVAYGANGSYKMHVYPEGGGKAEEYQSGKWKMEGDQLVLSPTSGPEARSLPRIVGPGLDTMELTAGMSKYHCRRTTGGAGSTGGAASSEGPASSDGASPAPE